MAGGRGAFITLEGGEGAGKSTQIGLLADRLTVAGRRVVRTREPGGAPGAEEIRRLLVEGTPDRWDAMTETLLHLAARRDHLRAVVRPALAEGKWVLCDRFSDSTVAYQGFGHGVDRGTIDALHGLAVEGFKPDLTLILDLPVDEGLRRAGGRAGNETRYERMDRAFHERLREGFLTIAREEPERCVVINSTAQREKVAARIWDAVRERLSP